MTHFFLHCSPCVYLGTQPKKLSKGSQGSPISPLRPTAPVFPVGPTRLGLPPAAENPTATPTPLSSHSLLAIPTVRGLSQGKGPGTILLLQSNHPWPTNKTSPTLSDITVFPSGPQATTHTDLKVNKGH
jgi:hypothetical protein